LFLDHHWFAFCLLILSNFLLSLSPLSIQVKLWVALLGIFATAIATIVYFRLVKSAGPSFVSQLNYLIPLWAVGVGMLFRGEEPEKSHLYALALILCGVLVTQLERCGGRERTKPGSGLPE